MSISRFYTTTVAVARKVWAGNSATESSVGNFKAHIQQATPEFAESIGQAWGETFTIWCAIGTDVNKGDTLTIASGDYAGTYSVSNVQTNATGANEHLELVIIKDVTN